MTKKAIVLCLTIFLVGMAITARGQTAPPNRVVSERLIGKIHPSWIPESVKVSPDGRRVAYVTVHSGWFAGQKQFVVVDGKEEKPYDGLVRGGRIIFDSPDSLHYLAWKGDDMYLVEEKIE